VRGLIAGFVGSKLVNKNGRRVLPRHRPGYRRRCDRGLVVQPVRHARVTGLNIYSLIVAVVGAVVSWWSTTRSGDALCDRDSDFLHHQDGTFADERDGHRVGADAVARDAARGVGGAAEGQCLTDA
jgi:uncharacterized membrane protein YeaQ/YmgE (transglycosylase-associated protein family)